MKHRLISAVAIAATLVTLVGCQNGSVMTSQDINNLRHPALKMPKEAYEAMANAGKHGPPPPPAKSGG